MKNISTLLQEADQLKSKKDRIAYLQKFANPALNKIFRYAYGKDIKFLLPEGTPPFKPSRYDEPGNLYQEVKRLYLFIEGGQQNLSNLKRESLFIETLEYVDEPDAKLLIGVKDKKLPYKNITEELVREALPGIFADEEV